MSVKRVLVSDVLFARLKMILLQKNLYKLKSKKT